MQAISIRLESVIPKQLGNGDCCPALQLARITRLEQRAEPSAYRCGTLRGRCAFGPPRRKGCPLIRRRTRPMRYAKKPGLGPRMQVLRATLVEKSGLGPRLQVTRGWHEKPGLGPRMQVLRDSCQKTGLGTSVADFFGPRYRKTGLGTPLACPDGGECRRKLGGGMRNPRSGSAPWSPPQPRPRQPPCNRGPKSSFSATRAEKICNRGPKPGFLTCYPAGVVVQRKCNPLPVRGTLLPGQPGRSQHACDDLPRVFFIIPAASGENDEKDPR